MKKMGTLYKKRLSTQVLNSTQGGGFWGSLVGSAAIEILSGFQDEIIDGVEKIGKGFEDTVTTIVLVGGAINAGRR